MPSKEFNKLERNVAKLKTHFLNFEKSVDGNYSDYDLMNCRAFVAFAHAEVESYLEGMAEKILIRAKTKFTTDNKVGQVVAGLLSFRRRQETSTPDDVNAPGARQTITFLVNEAIETQEQFIKRNNGIKPSNFSNVFAPLGVQSDHLSEALMIQLKNFGNVRGDLVHTNSQVSLPRLRDPFDDEYKDVQFLVEELKSFDEAVRNLR